MKNNGATGGLKNIVYEYLLNSILSDSLQPGHVIVEQEVSDLLGISRTPVREALKMLEADGLVHHIPSRGTFVKEISIQDVEEIFQLRELFEITALKVAIKEISDEEIDYIEECLHVLNDDGIGKANINEEFYRSDRELHQIIMRYIGNSRAIQFYTTLEVQLERLRRISSMTPSRLSKSKQEHIDIVKAIRSRDLQDATNRLSSHLNNVKESIKSVCHLMWLNNN